MSTPAPPEKVPQPVIKNTAATALALVLVTDIAGFTAYQGWWEPSVADIAQYASLFGTLVGVVLLVQGWIVHKRVTPNANVALTKVEAKMITLAEAPAVKFGPTRVVSGSLDPPNPRYNDGPAGMFPPDDD